LNFNGYDIDFERAIAFIKKKNAHTIFVQLPEGLKQYMNQLEDLFIQQVPDVHVVIGADPCYGACDLPCDDELSALDVDLLIHIGHTIIPSMKYKSSIDLLFLNASSLHPIDPVVTKAARVLKGPAIGVVTTAQHLHQIPQIKNILEENGLTVFIGEGDKRVSAQGQVLGCNFSAATCIRSKVDSYLYVGSGFFHPLGLSLSTQKPVVIADPYTEKVITKELEEIKDRVIRQRYGAITQAKMAENYGILVGLKPGQQRMNYALKIKQKIQETGKNSYLLTVDHISPLILDTFPFIDCFVSTLCPRVAIDDHLQYKQTLITPVELDIALGKRSWDTYIFDEIQ
jgi:2-(3-amino-3-carboxypropyl)histidine synthase